MLRRVVVTGCIDDVNKGSKYLNSSQHRPTFAATTYLRKRASYGIIVARIHRLLALVVERRVGRRLSEDGQ